MLRGLRLRPGGRRRVTLAFHVLGRVTLVRDGVPQPVGGHHPRLVLALLLLGRGRAITNESLVDRLWPDEPPDTAPKTVQVYVSRLRGLLEEHRDRLASDSSGYRLTVEPGELDADAFADEVRRGHDAVEAGQGGDALQLVEGALVRWLGDPFGDLRDEPSLRREVDRLEDLRADAEEIRARAYLQTGRGADAIAGLRALVADRPGRESAWRHLVLGLYAAGRQADALQAFHEARRYLDEGLGIEPGPELQAAHLAVLQQTAPVARRTPGGEAQASRSSSTAPGHMAMLGRDEELEAVRASVEAGARLVTLVGPGGIGKTTLARAALARIAAAGMVRPVFAELEAITDPALVPSAVAEALGDPADPADTIGDTQTTLVLDNLEQVIDAASWVGKLLASCPNLAIVATSREALRIDGEQLIPLGPLPPDAATELFLARARLVRPDLAPSAAIAAICKRLDWVPLAIELAAARTNLLSPEALSARLGQVLDVLGSRRRDGSGRQRTLRATIAWSHDLLSEDERRVFERLGIFAGAFGVQAAEAVVGASLDDLDSLLDRNLLTTRFDDREPTFRLLQTIREFAIERLTASGELEETRRPHAAWVIQLAETVPPTGRWSSEDVARVAAHLDDCRAVLVWTAAEGEDELRWRLAVALSHIWQTRGHHREGRHWLEDGLDSALIPDALRLDALDVASALASRQGDVAAVEDLSGRALELARRLESNRHVVSSLAKLAQAAIATGRPDDARTMHEEAIALSTGESDRRPLLVSLTSQANLDLLEGRAEEAAAAFEYVLPIARDVAGPGSVATAQFNLGLARLLAGAPAAARELLTAALAAYAAMNDVDGVGYVLVAAAALALRRDPRVAAMAIGSADAALASVGTSLEPVEFEAPRRNAR